MFTRIAAAALAIVAPAFATQEGSSAPEPIDVGFIIGPTQFFARNFSADPQVLFFHSGTITTWRRIAPGALYYSTYARSALDTVQLEVASYIDGEWHASRAFDMSGVCDLGADALWVQAGNPRPSWLQVGSTLSAYSADPSFLPAWIPGTSEPSAPAMAPVSVPVTTPVEIDGIPPPKLDDNPLPPF